MNTLRRGRRRYLSICLGMIVVLALASMLAACGVTTVNNGSQQSQGTLTGDVVAGPTKPVQSSDTPDDTRPVPYREVLIETPSGAQVATATTDTQGHFSVTLAPGTYMVRVKTETGKIGMRQYTVPTVHIVAGQTTHVRIQLDTGIR